MFDESYSIANLWHESACFAILLLPICEPLDDINASRTWPSLADVAICVSPQNGINFDLERI